MALFAIPNPKKTINLDFNIDKVKKAILTIPLINKKYKFTNSSEVLNQYTLEALEFLSIGVYIDFNLSTVSENKTEITIEIRRKVGSFDQSHEITNANKHLEVLIQNLSYTIMYSESELENLKKAHVDKIIMQKEKEKKTNKRNLIIAGVIVFIIIIFNLINKK